ncbi:ABC transporter substrate-binding protein [Streptomyces sp. NPDC056716]|uniref:ABC transporter substrate-binding protein n=1 Tax=unclassified Streptomyces TaxID=2593676 RepID=UPI00368681EE
MVIRNRILPTALLCLLSVTACGTSAGGSGTDATASGAVTSLKVGTSPALTNASLYLAAEDGTFARNHVKVTPQVLNSGAQAVPLLLNGQIQFAASDPLSALVAIANNTSLVIVAQGPVVPENSADDPTGLLVPKDSSMREATGTAGKTIAINALNSVSEVSMKAGIDALGGDSSKVKFVEVPFAQMVDAVTAGRVDAVGTTEPYVTEGTEKGLVRASYGGLSQTMGGVPQLVYLASESYADSNPSVVKSFADSITAANGALENDPEKIRTVGAESTSVPASVLDKITLPTFIASGLTLDQLTRLQDLMVKYGVIDKPVPELAQHVITATG